MSGLHQHDHGHTHGKPGGGTTRVVGITLAVNLCITAAKWFAFAVTRSPSLFGEAAHSTADSLNPLVLWFGTRRSGRPAHDKHPRGHGREAYFWSLIAAQMMLLIGATLTAVHGVDTLLNGSVPSINASALVIMGLAALGETYSLVVVWKHMQSESRTHGDAHGRRNPILLALLIENGTDVLGVLLALAGYGLYALTGNAAWDACFSLVIAAVLGTSSLFLINRSRSLIIGETAGPEIESVLRAAIDACPNFATTERILTVMHGPLDVEVMLTLKWNIGWFIARLEADIDAATATEVSLRAGNMEIEKLRAEIRQRLPQVSRVTVDTTC